MIEQGMADRPLVGVLPVSESEYHRKSGIQFAHRSRNRQFSTVEWPTNRELILPARFYAAQVNGVLYDEQPL
jgi:hypothetical protein